MEPKRYVVDTKQLVQQFFKIHKIYEGRWGIYAEFKMTATNFKTDIEGLEPGVIGILQKIGIEQITKDNVPAFDASELNPRPKRKKST